MYYYYIFNVKSKIGTKPALPTVSGTLGVGSEDVCNEEVNRTPSIHFHAFIAYQTSSQTDAFRQHSLLQRLNLNEWNRSALIHIPSSTEIQTVQPGANTKLSNQCA